MHQLLIGDILDALAAKSGYDERRMSTALGLSEKRVRTVRGLEITAAQAREFCRVVGLDFDAFAADMPREIADS